MQPPTLNFFDLEPKQISDFELDWVLYIDLAEGFFSTQTKSNSMTQLFELKTPTY